MQFHNMKKYCSLKKISCALEGNVLLKCFTVTQARSAKLGNVTLRIFSFLSGRKGKISDICEREDLRCL